MKTVPFPRIPPSAAAVLVCGAVLASPFASAQTLVEPFDSPLGELPPGWKVEWRASAQLGIRNGIARISELPDGSGHALLQSRTDGAGGNSLVYLAHSEGLLTHDKLGDFTAAATYRYEPENAGENDHRGVLIRAREADSDGSGYLISIQGNGTLSIIKNPDGHDGGQRLASARLLEQLAGKDYRLVIRAEGDQITATVFSWNDGDGQFSHEMGMVHAVDASHSAGYFGFRSLFRAPDRSTWWRDLEIELID